MRFVAKQNCCLTSKLGASHHQDMFQGSQKAHPGQEQESALVLVGRGPRLSVSSPRNYCWQQNPGLRWRRLGHIPKLLP